MESIHACGRKLLLSPGPFGQSGTEMASNAGICNLRAAHMQRFRSYRRTDFANLYEIITSQSHRVHPNTTTALPRCERQYLTDAQAESRRFPAHQQQGASPKKPTIKSISVLLDISPDREVRLIAAIMWLSNIARTMLRHLIVISNLMRPHANEKKKKEKKEKEERRKEEWTRRKGDAEHT